MKKIFITTVFAALSCMGSAQATALPDTCASAQLASSQPHGDNALAGHNYNLALAGNVHQTFHAGDIAASGTGLGPLALRDMEDVASLVLLATLTGHHSQGCAEGYFMSAATPIMDGLRAGRSYDLIWQDGLLSSGETKLSFHRAHLHLVGAKGDTAPATLTLDTQGLGIAGSHNTLLVNALPQQATANASVPSASLVPLAAAIAGHPTEAVMVPLHVSSLTAQRGAMQITGNGDASLTGNTDASSANGHIQVQNLDAVIETMRNAGQTRASAALVLAKLFGHKSATGGTGWDVNWEGGVMTVNHIPLPIR
ncbi:hypothetical protein CFR77_05225 [Komagataeibacter sucrofermentans]|uniref:DUF2125 domain-containing protein n=2 Tax=Komagataeibacter sucrofermentans TaxID=1053551 RepID=A0A318QLI3_9PROT|nr:hypothetical protein CFR77_05225 [Komagataeibacter sucrofermentans]GBQ52046.1 hypothetical protein AA15973_2637 [Komagataeibacter sucrofermentans DSM 15973]